MFLVMALGSSLGASVPESVGEVAVDMQVSEAAAAPGVQPRPHFLPFIPWVDTDGDTMTGDLVMNSPANVRFTASNGVSFPGGLLKGNTQLTYGPNLVCLDSGVGCPANNDWRLTGNAGTVAGTNFLGTTDNVALELKVNGARALRVEPATSPNIVGGHSSNSVASGKTGGTVAGGGATGSPNQANGDFGTVGGGKLNKAGSQFTTGVCCDTVAGGVNNTANGNRASVGGGEDNLASGPWSTVAGGRNNKATGNAWPAIGGGLNNQATGSLSTVAGGQNNIASAQHATVGGGNFNKATGTWSTVPGGDQNTASGQHSLAAGLGATAAHTGSFVWNADHSTFTTIGSSAQDQFTARAVGGFRFITSTNPAIGCFIPSGAITCSSDRDVKTDIVAVDSQAVLRGVAAMPISSWRYQTEQPGVKHIGPMAQDFMAAFHLGESDKQIGMLDEGGVALAAIQGLYQDNLAKDARIASLEARLAALEAALGTVHS